MSPNPKIKELIKSLGIIPEDEHYEVAELIVQECTSLFDGTKEMKTVGMLTHNQVVEQIKKHFGVEE